MGDLTKPKQHDFEFIRMLVQPRFVTQFRGCGITRVTHKFIMPMIMKIVAAET